MKTDLKKKGSTNIGSFEIELAQAVPRVFSFLLFFKRKKREESGEHSSEDGSKVL